MTTEASARPAISAAVVERAVSGAVSLGTGAVLGLALWLEPSAAGHGTHLQLGLGTCSFLTFTGHPCPMCGATTTFALMASLRPLDALWNQPFAAVLFLMTLFAFGVSLAEVAWPTRRWTRLLTWLEPVEHWLAGAFLLLMAVAWAWKDLQMTAH